MAIPDFQSVMLPLLKHAADGKEHSFVDAIDAIADEFKLTLEERHARLPKSGNTILDNRVGWAKTYLARAGLLEQTRRSFFRITPEGTKVLETRPNRVDIKFLRQFPTFEAFRAKRREADLDEPSSGQTGHVQSSTPTFTPRESLEVGYAALRAQLADDLLSNIKARSPRFFEELVVELLLKMGYGRFHPDAGEATGKPGDEGIDGIINEDRLGLDRVCIQAKKWSNTVGRDELQKFAGALKGKGAQKGVFITTSDFSDGARKYAESLGHDTRIALIDGAHLAELMIDYGLGVSTVDTYEVKQIDTDFFAEDPR